MTGFRDAENWRAALEDRFVALLRERWRRGAREYGDASFTRPLPSTVDEIGQELLDVCGWAFVLWVQLQQIQAGTDRLVEGRG